MRRSPPALSAPDAATPRYAIAARRASAAATRRASRSWPGLLGALLLGLSLPLLSAPARAQNPSCVDIPFSTELGFCDLVCFDGSTRTCGTLNGFILGGCTCDEPLPVCTDPPTVEPCNPPIVVIGCTGRDQIIQKDCLGAPAGLGTPLVRSITSESITGVLEDHLLPYSDQGLILHSARESVRARFFGELLAIIQEPPPLRTAEDDELVAYYAGELQDLRIAEAQVSEAEYARYVAQGQCGYVPPAGFTFEFPSACYTPLGIFDPTPKHPTLEEFKAYGYAAVTRELLEDPEALAAIDGTARSIGFGVAAAAGVGVAVGVFVFLLVNTAAFTALLGTIFPFTIGLGYVALTAKIGALASTAFSGIAAGVAGAVGIVIFGIIFIVFSFIDLFDYTTFVDRVTHLVEVAETVPPELRVVVADPVGMSELYQAYIKTTLPEFPPTAPVPAASVCDPLFALADEQGTALGVAATIQPLVTGAFAGMQAEVGLRGGWFAPTLTIPDPSQPGEPPAVSTQLSLRLPVLAWDGQPQDVWRRGSRFIEVDPDDVKNNQLHLVEATTDFEFLDASGARRAASLVFDETAECEDLCPDDPEKTRPGACGCGIPDVDESGDGEPECFDACPDDPAKTHPGCSGCGVPDPDVDGDGSPDCFDACPADASKTGPGECGCGMADVDSDGDGTLDCRDVCPADPIKILAGACGCGFLDIDVDTDQTPDCLDLCPNDPTKVAPDACGCNPFGSTGDVDGDGTIDCHDGCVDDPGKIAAGVCGCGVADTDGDGDTTADCIDACADDPGKIEAGVCGCGVADTDGDGDGTADCIDACADDPGKIEVGVCGCGTPDDDLDSDGQLGCVDNCPVAANASQEDFDGDGLGDVCDEDADGDAVADAGDGCAFTPLGVLVDATGCSVDQLVPCDGPSGTTRAWRNHGQYVSSLSKTLGAFVTAGLLSEAEKDALVAAGAEGSCGL